MICDEQDDGEAWLCGDDPINVEEPVSNTVDDLGTGKVPFVVVWPLLVLIKLVLEVVDTSTIDDDDDDDDGNGPSISSCNCRYMD